ncbi:hypothetical protein T10_8685 [Trichinella papuae]|uniref:Uncharacterized protein n=1 Tax=Trichinella papuae TaxID=268474 RepID=A0A0V1MU70_9BILA|nr:hypothetical protein T10_8685 [Trichinella papuae]
MHEITNSVGKFGKDLAPLTLGRDWNCTCGLIWTLWHTGVQFGRRFQGRNLAQNSATGLTLQWGRVALCSCTRLEPSGSLEPTRTVVHEWKVCKWQKWRGLGGVVLTALDAHAGGDRCFVAPEHQACTNPTLVAIFAHAVLYDETKLKLQQLFCFVFSVTTVAPIIFKTT